MDQKYGCKRTAVKKTQAYRRLQKNQQFRKYKHTWTYLFISGSKSCYNHNRMHSNIQSLHGNWNIASAYQVWLKNCMTSAVMIYWPIILLLLNCMNSAVMIYWPIILLLLNCMTSAVMIYWPIILLLLKLHEFCGYDILANHFGVAEDLNLMAIVTHIPGCNCKQVWQFRQIQDLTVHVHHKTHTLRPYCTGSAPRQIQDQQTCSS